ncbi:hypothetical protein B0H11DRAFT_2079654 [Mycena galericulata]|nr:hypothetical protein B0H11DRAFT_2125252 [Mycena galericulata]KAJ7449138.1 hypothetical protein B0H11DRAFT_2079654 [Mycena galericulata]
MQTLLRPMPHPRCTTLVLLLSFRFAPHPCCALEPTLYGSLPAWTHRTTLYDSTLHTHSARLLSDPARHPHPTSCTKSRPPRAGPFIPFPIYLSILAHLSCLPAPGSFLYFVCLSICSRSPLIALSVISHHLICYVAPSTRGHFTPLPPVPVLRIAYAYAPRTLRPPEVQAQAAVRVALLPLPLSCLCAGQRVRDGCTPTLPPLCSHASGADA